MRLVVRSRYSPFLGGVIAILLIFVVVKGVMILGELQCINWASGRLDYVQAQAQKDNAKDYVLTRIKECFYIEGTDFTKGNLRCGVGLKLQVTGANSSAVSERVGDLFASASSDRAFGSAFNSAGRGSRFAVNQPNLTCSYSIDSNLPQMTKPYIETATIECDVSASWQYYALASS